MSHQTTAIGSAVAVLFATAVLCSTAQAPIVHSLNEERLREYAGVYEWGPNAYVYLQMWSELTGNNQLVAFDESGDVRTLYPTGNDRFFTGPAAAVSTEVESRVEFHRNVRGKIAFLTWDRDGSGQRTARRVEIEEHEDVSFSNGDVHLAGTLITPIRGVKRPAIILVPASGAEDREYLLPFAHFLVRHGMAVLGYDKRGVGNSTGDWRTESFDDLAGDAITAFEYLKTRPDIDSSQIGFLGLRQAGWVMPLAAIRAKDLAFLISISGAGVPVAETTIDEARGEMMAAHMPPAMIQQIVELMNLQYHFAQTAQGWDEYAAAREKLAARMGKPPDTFPGTQNDPYWQNIRRLYFYDPTPTLRRLRTPTLALFGGLDDNILAEKNKAAWDTALKASGNPDYTLQILPNADHLMLEAKVGNNAEMPTLQRFLPAYFATVQGWLPKRIHSFVSVQ
jgi:hypothetical protein